MCVGPRRLTVRPIYSQHTRGGGKGVNNVHKFERFLRHGQAYVATVYGPITFGNQPCILLRESDDEGTFYFSRFLALSFRCTDSGAGPKLVASGAFMNADTTRIIAKRIILTGHPFKVHKRTATVRYMFFNPGKYFLCLSLQIELHDLADDIAYFKPIQLHTKHGRTGHIKESLGTHGYFKAHFDGPLSQMDTVCMSLYKRVYPKWAEQWKEPRLSQDGREEDRMEE
jgi:pre-rRNA-processing protein TSR1